MEWEINRISTSERIFSKIKEEMPQPVGIILFGADYAWKDKIKEEIINVLDMQTGFDKWSSDYEDAEYYMKTKEHFRYRFEEGRRFMLTILSSDYSCSRELREGFSEAIKNAGAKTVVGIYAKAKEIPTLFPIGKSITSTHQHKQINGQTAIIEESNPSVAEFDYYIVAPEEEKEEK